MNKKGFSLIELSIVLVILGLLAGGILAGKSLIRAAELRSVGTDVARYQTAMHGFRDKYFGMPGDITNATMIWGKDATNCAGQIGAAATLGTCNGNGNGMWDSPASASATGENFQAWKQLALAGLVEGQYSGISGSNSSSDVVPVGTNVPASKIPNAGYALSYMGFYAGDSNHYGMTYANHLIFGKGLTLYSTLGSLLKPEEVWNIDTKIDDGMPGTGKLILTYWTSCSTSTSATDFAGQYNNSVTASSCAFRYKNII